MEEKEETVGLTRRLCHGQGGSEEGNGREEEVKAVLHVHFECDGWWSRSAFESDIPSVHAHSDRRGEDESEVQDLLREDRVHAKANEGSDRDPLEQS